MQCTLHLQMPATIAKAIAKAVICIALSLLWLLLGTTITSIQLPLAICYCWRIVRAMHWKQDFRARIKYAPSTFNAIKKGKQQYEHDEIRGKDFNIDRVLWKRHQNGKEKNCYLLCIKVKNKNEYKSSRTESLGSCTLSFGCYFFLFTFWQWNDCEPTTNVSNKHVSQYIKRAEVKILIYKEEKNAKRQANWREKNNAAIWKETTRRL